MGPQLVFFTFLISFAAAQNTDAKGNIVCAFPISGQYCILQRVLFYVLISFSIVVFWFRGFRWQWLVRGSFVTAMVYSAVASIHAIVLAAMNRRYQLVIDLDIFGTHCIITSSLVLLAPMLHFCKEQGKTAARGIVCVWGILVFLGTVSTTWVLHSVKRPSRVNPTCFSQAAQSLLDQCSCAGFKQSNSSLIRSPTELVAVPESRIFGYWFPVVSNGVSSISIALVFGTILLIHTWNLFEIHWCRGLRFKSRDATNSGQFLVKMLLALLASIGFGLNISPMEFYILQHSGLPTGEKYFSIGQWGPWASAVLVLISACSPQLEKQWWRKLKADQWRDMIRLKGFNIRDRNPHQPPAT